jgi:hypothetical protein
LRHRLVPARAACRDPCAGGLPLTHAHQSARTPSQPSRQCFTTDLTKSGRGALSATAFSHSPDPTGRAPCHSSPNCRSDASRVQPHSPSLASHPSPPHICCEYSVATPGIIRAGAFPIPACITLVLHLVTRLGMKGELCARASIKRDRYLITSAAVNRDLLPSRSRHTPILLSLSRGDGGWRQLCALRLALWPLLCALICLCLVCLRGNMCFLCERPPACANSRCAYAPSVLGAQSFCALCPCSGTLSWWW